MRFLIRYAPTSHPVDLCRIALSRGRYVIVDEEDFAWLSKYRWYAKMSNCCWYAVRKKWVNGKCTMVRMHREIMHTPDDMICHHIFSNSLDNRKSQLENLTPRAHKEVHRTRIYATKNTGTPTEKHKNTPF